MYFVLYLFDSCRNGGPITGVINHNCDLDLLIWTGRPTPGSAGACRALGRGQGLGR